MVTCESQWATCLCAFAHVLVPEVAGMHVTARLSCQLRPNANALDMQAATTATFPHLVPPCPAALSCRSPPRALLRNSSQFKRELQLVPSGPQAAAEQASTPVSRRVAPPAAAVKESAQAAVMLLASFDDPRCELQEVATSYKHLTGINAACGNLIAVNG